jgi:elongation factor G
MSDVTRTRIFALIGHGGDGKTTLADSLAMAAGVVNRLGSVEDGTSFMNYLPEEKARRITISASVCSFEKDGFHMCVVDTPGDSNFAGELVGALQAVDHAVLVVASGEDVKVGTDKAFKLARGSQISVTAVANKMDHEAADFDATASNLERDLGTRVVKLHLPIGSGVQYRGYVDLITRKAHSYSGDGSGSVDVGDVPGDLADAVEEARMAMVEAVAEGDDAILEKYLEEGELSEDEIEQTLRKGTREGLLMPLISAAADRNVGGRALLELAMRFFPSPADVPARTAKKRDEEVELIPDADAPFAAAVFKSVADRYAGALSLLRVYSGTLRTDMTVLNSRTGTKERIGKILRLVGEETNEIKQVEPGGIAALAKLKDTHSGDTLCDEKHAVEVTDAPPPTGVISFAVTAAKKGDEDKVRTRSSSR